MKDRSKNSRACCGTLIPIALSFMDRKLLPVGRLHLASLLDCGAAVPPAVSIPAARFHRVPPIGGTSPYLHPKTMISMIYRL